MNAQKTIVCIILFLMMSYSRIIAGGSSGSPAGGTQPSANANSGGTTAFSASNKAYGDNLKEMEPGVFAIYSGDVSVPQDGYIATDDVSDIDNDNLIGLQGPYLLHDLNGDTYVGTDDVALCDNNNLVGIQIQRP